jgi:cobalt-precorrin 5A hydrolase
MDFAMQSKVPDASTAIVALTAHGVNLALQLQAKLPESVCYVPERHSFALAMEAKSFERLKDVFPEIWSKHSALICIMATGIVVRLIAPHLDHKSLDPAVVVMDERGQYVISLLSGHLGGANGLATKVAQLIGAQPVITTASDVQHKPAWDLIAQEAGLDIEDIRVLPRVTRAVLEDEPVWIYDPENRLHSYIENNSWRAQWPELHRVGHHNDNKTMQDIRERFVGIWVSEHYAPSDLCCLELRPRNLVVGIGCNRGTTIGEILELLRNVFQKEGLSFLSIRNLASIDLKKDESGLLEVGKLLKRPISFYSKESIETVAVANPSPAVETHVGVQSVCEATALLSTENGTLVVPKQKTANVTLAVAKVSSPS